MDLGKRQVLKVLRIKDFGAYLGDDADSKESVLLPKKELQDRQVGDEVEVFLYKDSSDRLIASTRQSYISVGEVKRLKVKECGKIGAFLDMGLERDLLLPYKEMTGNLIAGDEALVAMYVDRSGRLAATMRIYPYLRSDSPYRKDDEVSACIYREKEHEYLAAVEESYYGAIPKREVFERYCIGQELRARVLRVREDGKLDISPRRKAYAQLEEDAALIYAYLSEKGGHIGFDDKADPELIRRTFALSKNAFKRAVGHLLKEKKIKLENEDIIKL